MQFKEGETNSQKIVMDKLHFSTHHLVRQMIPSNSCRLKESFANHVPYKLLLPRSLFLIVPAIFWFYHAVCVFLFG